MVNKNRALEQFMELVRIDSVSKNERQMADYLLGHFQKLGYEAVEDLKSRDEIPGGTSGNVIVKIPGKGNLAKMPAIMLCAHMDTVEPGNGIIPHITADGKFIVSDGTTILGADDKGGISQIIELEVILREHNLAHPPLELLFPVCEEIRLLGSRALDTTLVSAKVAFVLDGGPDVGDALVGGPTAYDVEAIITGKSAHAGVEPELGISSIQVLGHAIANMKLLKVDEDTSSNIGFVETKYPLNVVAEKTTVGFEVRSLDAKKADDQLDHLLACITDACAKFGATATFDVTKVLTAYKLEKDNPVLKKYYDVCESSGISVTEIVSRGGTDLSSLIGHGIEGIVIATGGDNLHSVRERLDIDIFMNSIELLIKLITI
ncbi:peptidase T [Erysipelotrichaceae bacterium]|nr:peptidase T [Erysipelotrichaceae bacterium]